MIIDLLRASTSIVRALDSGASEIVPVLEPDQALRLASHELVNLPGGDRPLLGGERHGGRITGFDLGNSPSEYAPGVVGGRSVVFTTTNGTRAILAARAGGAVHILIGSLNNCAAVAEAAVAPLADIHLICAGTGGRFALDDMLCAGAIADAVLRESDSVRPSPEDDAGPLARALWSATGGDPAAILARLRGSLGARNLAAIGLEADVADCARRDVSRCVPRLGADGRLRTR